MTKEELQAEFCNTMLAIFDGKAVFHHDTSGSVSLRCGDHVVDNLPVDFPGWIDRALLRLLNEVIKDFEYKLKEYEIEEVPQSPRALRRVRINGRERTNRSCD